LTQERASILCDSYLRFPSANMSIMLPATTSVSTWLAVVGAWLCFGSFAVPMKWKSVVSAQVHPFVFQCHKTFWVFVTAHLILLFQPYEITWWGLLSGVFWVPAGTAGVYAVRHVGIACAQAVWQSMAVLTSCFWGFIVLQDTQMHNPLAASAAVTLLVSGIVGMSMALSPLAAAPEETECAQDGLQLKKSNSVRRAHNDEEAIMPEVREAEGEMLIEKHKVAAGALRNVRNAREQNSTCVAFGIAAALFNGAWGGSNQVPQVLAPIHGTHFLISFATGALIVNVFLGLVYAHLAKFYWNCPMPSLEIRTLFLPGMLSGVLWSGGNFCALYAVNILGMAVGFSLVQCSILVAGLWGIVFYHEMTGRPVLYWCVGCAMCLLGVAVFAYEQEPLRP